MYCDGQGYFACYWVPSTLNPADPPSRWQKYDAAIQVDLQASRVYASLLQSPFSPPFVGEAKYRG